MKKTILFYAKNKSESEFIYAAFFINGIGRSGFYLINRYTKEVTKMRLSDKAKYDFIVAEPIKLNEEDAEPQINIDF